MDAPTPLFDNLKNMLATDNAFAPNISASQLKDYQQAKQFLLSYRGSEATFNAYRREVERFLHWCTLAQHKTLGQVTREDFEAYIEFCQNPPDSWIGLKKTPRFKKENGLRIPNTDWRPFVVTLSKVEARNGKTADTKDYMMSEKAIREVFAIISSFYNFLVQEDYVANNPVAQIRQKSKYLRKYHNKAKIRRLSELQWSYVIETAELLAKQDPAKHERTLFVMQALYGMYLRISELAADERWTPTMGDFERDHDGNWWFTTVGKGNKERQITVSDAMLAALKRYRLSLGLSETPPPGDHHPLILRQRGRGPVSSTRHIREIVQQCFDAAIERLKRDGFTEEAEQMNAATVHWLRHTGISDDVKFRPREHVRDDAGHSSSAITDRYIDIELRERHASARKKKIKPDD